GDLPYLVEMAGADRILFGSDFGFSNWRLLTERLDDVYQSELPAEIMQKILAGNAARLLHLQDHPLPQT
ncbi:MAG: amidohydrolase family protein, partial [Abditibacteriaceae bacterium]